MTTVEWAFDQDPTTLMGIVYYCQDQNYGPFLIRDDQILFTKLYVSRPEPSRYNTDELIAFYIDQWIDYGVDDSSPLRLVLFPTPSPIGYKTQTTYRTLRYFTEILFEKGSLRVFYYVKCGENPYYSYGCCDSKWSADERIIFRETTRHLVARQSQHVDYHKHFKSTTLSPDTLQILYPKSFERYSKFKALYEMTRKELIGLYKVMHLTGASRLYWVWTKTRLIQKLYYGDEIPSVYLHTSREQLL